MISALLTWLLLPLLVCESAHARQVSVELLCPGFAGSRHAVFFHDEQGVELGSLVVGPTATWAWAARVDLENRPARAVVTGAVCNFEAEIPASRAPIAIVGCAGEGAPDFSSPRRLGPVLWSTALSAGLREECPGLFERWWASQAERERLDQLEVLRGTVPEVPLDITPGQELVDPAETQAELALRLDLGAGERDCLADLGPAFEGLAPLDPARWDSCRPLPGVRARAIQALSAGTAPLELLDAHPEGWLDDPEVLGALTRRPDLPSALERLFRVPQNEKRRKQYPFFRVEGPIGPAALLVWRGCAGEPAESESSFRVFGEVLVLSPRPSDSLRGELLPWEQAQAVHHVLCGARGGESWVDRTRARQERELLRELQTWSF